MTDPNNDIDALLRYLKSGHTPHWYDDSTRWHAALTALVAERDALLKENVALRDRLKAKQDELLDREFEMDMLRKQRDEATAWRPIETAPIDGTVVMLYGDGRVTCGSWIAEQVIMVGEHHHTTGEWLGAYPSGETTPAYWQSHDGGFTEEHPPTHWMPLPQPPREKEGGGA